MHLRLMSDPLRFRGCVGRLARRRQTERDKLFHRYNDGCAEREPVRQPHASLLDDHQFDEWTRDAPDQAVTLLTPYPARSKLGSWR